MKAPIRILFNIFADERNVNAQSLNARDIALRLDEQRFECSMFVLKQPDSRLVNRKNIHLVRLPARMGSLVIASHLIWGRYDIVFYPPFDHLMAWCDSLKWTRRKKKVIATAEGTAEALQTLPSPVRERLLRMLRDADACYAISSYIAESMSRQFDLRMGVVPIGVDTGMFAPCERAERLGPVKVLCVSSIQPRKQLDLILDLAREVGPREAEFNVIGDVIGTSAYRDSLLKRKGDENLEHVLFRGKMLQREVCEWMQESDIFILPSRFEGTPKVVYEAAASGLPCIVFDDYHTPSVVHDITGFQVKTFQEMLRCLRGLMNNRDLRLRMGIAGVQHAKRFDWGVVVKQWEEVFERTIEGNHATLCWPPASHFAS